MKGKRFKNCEDLVEEYLQLADEKLEIPIQIEKNKEKIDDIISDKTGQALKSGAANTLYKLFSYTKKLEERKIELETEYNETEELLKQFLAVLDGNKLSYKERDEEDKTTNTHLFWLEENVIKSNR